MELNQKKCIPCEAGTAPLARKEIEGYLGQLKSQWTVADGKKIRREFIFKDFKAAMAFINRVAEKAEEEGHHPDIHVFYNRVVIELWTHAISGLSENDFILAAKIEKLLT